MSEAQWATPICLTCLQGGAVNEFRESSIHDMTRPAFRGMAHEFAPVTLTVSPHPAPSPSAAHAGLLADLQRALDHARGEGHDTVAFGDLFVDRIMAALRAASPAPVAVEAAYREGYEDAADEDSMPHKDYSWHHSAARRGAAGGTDGE